MVLSQHKSYLSARQSFSVRFCILLCNVGNYIYTFLSMSGFGCANTAAHGGSRACGETKSVTPLQRKEEMGSAKKRCGKTLLCKEEFGLELLCKEEGRDPLVGNPLYMRGNGSTFQEWLTLGGHVSAYIVVGVYTSIVVEHMTRLRGKPC